MYLGSLLFYSKAGLLKSTFCITRRDRMNDLMFCTKFSMKESNGVHIVRVGLVKAVSYTWG